MYAANLRSYMEAKGGRLKIIGRFPQGEVANTDLSHLGDERARPQPVGDYPPLRAAGNRMFTSDR